MKGACLTLSLIVVFIFAIAVATFAQGGQQTDPSTILNLDAGKKADSTEIAKPQPWDFRERFDLLNWPVTTERTDEDKKIRAISLYPQSFSAVKPEALQKTPPRSYFLSLDEPVKENTFVGLANIDTEEKMEIKGVYQKDLKTELLLGYRWGGFGSILFGKALQYERFGEDVGRLYDLGWRIKFMKTF